jgi:tRNA1Val (adenine37-N6)-methyltransferase
MKVTTDACLFGAWVASEVESEKLKVKRALDIGTGTGLLSLMLAQKCEAEINCVEIDEATAKQAQENAGSSPWGKRIFVMPGDAKKMTPTLCKDFDAIVSNPPFYEKEIRSATNSKNVAHHSEYLTLKDLLAIIKDSLTSTGLFFLLIPYKRNEEVKKLFKDQQLHISKMIFVRQSVKHDYFRIFLKGNLSITEKETEFDELSIWDEQQQYTNEFVELLKDYYLHL